MVDFRVARRDFQEVIFSFHGVYAQNKMIGAENVRNGKTALSVEARMIQFLRCLMNWSWDCWKPPQQVLFCVNGQDAYNEPMIGLIW